MKKLDKILAIASSVMLMSCIGEVKPKAKVILNKKGVPIELEYSSETPPLDEIFKDMQILENHVREKRKATTLNDQGKAYLICLNKLLKEYTEKHQKKIYLTSDCVKIDELLRQYNAEYGDFVRIISEEAANGEVGHGLFWAHYLSYLLSIAKINNHVLSLSRSGEHGVSHAIVIYKLNNNKEATGDEEIQSTPWMVLTCGYNPTKQESVLELTLEQYLLDYIREEKSDIKIRLASKTLGATVNQITFCKETPPTFTPEVIDMCINHLLTEPGKETELSRAIDSIKVPEE